MFSQNVFCGNWPAEHSNRAWECVCVCLCVRLVSAVYPTLYKKNIHTIFDSLLWIRASHSKFDAIFGLISDWSIYGICLFAFFFFCEKYTLRSEGEMFQFGSGYRRSAFFFYSSVLSVESVQLNSNTFIWELLRYCSCWKSRNQIAHYQCCSVAFLMRCCVRMPTSLCIFQFGLSKHQRYALARASL